MEMHRQKILAITLGIRFIQTMVIRFSIGNSKLCTVRPCPAIGAGLRPAPIAQLGKEGSALPLYPSPMPPLAATETLPVSAPSGGPSACRVYLGARCP